MNLFVPTNYFISSNVYFLEFFFSKQNPLLKIREIQMQVTWKCWVSLMICLDSIFQDDKHLQIFTTPSKKLIAWIQLLM